MIVSDHMHAKVQDASADFTMSELFPLNAAVKADSVAFEYNATPAAACTDCPSGTYSSSSGSVSAGTCVACPTHSSSPPVVCGTLSHHHIACVTYTYSIRVHTLAEDVRGRGIFISLVVGPLNSLFFFSTRPRLADALRCRGY